jgi:predicted glycogen debranching enzyme
MYYRTEDSRGESCLDDAFQPGWFDIPIDFDGKKKFCLIAAGGEREEEARKAFSTFSKELADFDTVYIKEVNRLEELLKTFQNQHTGMEMHDWLKWLVVATDSFVVNRRSTGRKSVIAGYPWFEDWGRDSLISLPGLTLATGRFREAREILLTFKQYCQKGTIPNKFPDQAGDEPIYNTVDASLWFFNAVLKFLKYTNNFGFVKEELWDTLESIVRYHVQGTPQGIRVDGDGLVQHGPRLTWMDAKANDQVVTPRQGKAVEIQALWYNALKTMELLSTRFNQEEEAAKYCAMAEKAVESFIGKFWSAENGFLYDVVHDGVGDPSLRPNQVIAVSLDFSMLDAMKQNAVVETVRKRLWGGYGLRTLAKDDARYVGSYIGDRYYRDNAYHNGTVWAWLLGPFVTAFLKVKKYDEQWRRYAFERFLQPLFCRETFQAGLGTISEIFDGDAPHRSRGCFAQAWSVAEPLRAFVEDVLLDRPPYEREVLGSQCVDY